MSTIAELHARMMSSDPAYRAAYQELLPAPGKVMCHSCGIYPATKYTDMESRGFLLLCDDSADPDQEAFGDDSMVCRMCGCIDSDCSECVERTGLPCYWVKDDLCSACASAIDRGVPE